MAGLTRFKIEEVNNGWIIEFHPRRGDLPDSQTRVERHVSQHGTETLLEIIHELLLEQARKVDEYQPTP